MVTQRIKKGLVAAYESPASYPRRRPYSVSPLFDVVVVVFAVLSVLGYLSTGT